MKKILATLCVMLVSSVFVMAQTDGTLTVTATTSQTLNPVEAPKNIVAIWVEDSSGKFVKTILAYAGERKQWLLAWKTSTIIAGSVYNVVDAVSGATKNSHAARTATWNGKNLSSTLVADGDYKVKMECTDNNGNAQNLATFTFAKGPSAVTLSPPTTNRFSNISIKWAPTNTDLLEVNEGELYKVYPNPTLNSLYVNGLGIKSLAIINENGLQILSSNDQSIDVSQLKPGLYFCRIDTENSQIYKKFIKK